MRSEHDGEPGWSGPFGGCSQTAVPAKWSGPPVSGVTLTMTPRDAKHRSGDPIRSDLTVHNTTAERVSFSTDQNGDMSVLTNASGEQRTGIATSDAVGIREWDLAAGDSASISVTTRTRQCPDGGSYNGAAVPAGSYYLSAWLQYYDAKAHEIRYWRDRATVVLE
jgi:hypothetical protein